MDTSELLEKTSDSNEWIKNVSTPFYPLFYIQPESHIKTTGIKCDRHFRAITGRTSSHLPPLLTSNKRRESKTNRKPPPGSLQAGCQPPNAGFCWCATMLVHGGRISAATVPVPLLTRGNPAFVETCNALTKT